MGSQGVYTFSLSNELRNYYRNYYGVKTTAEMAELTWIGANPGAGKGEPYSYAPLTTYIDPSQNNTYKLTASFDGGRIYALVPWRWSVLSKDQQLPSNWKKSPPKNDNAWGVDYLDYIFRHPDDFAINSQNSGWTPSILSNPIPFGYVETNSGKGKTNNGDLSLIDSNSLSLTIQQANIDQKNQGPQSSTTGTNKLIQSELWSKLAKAGATAPSTTVSAGGVSYNPIFDWVQLAPKLSTKYSDLKSYLQHLASLQAKDPQTPLAFLANDPKAGTSSVNASAYFFTDTKNNPFVLVDGGSGNLNAPSTPYLTGLWLLPWNANQLKGSALSQFNSTANSNAGPVGLESPLSIYGNAGTAIYINKRLAALQAQYGNNINIDNVNEFFNINTPSASYTGNVYYAGDLFIGLTYGLIGSTATLSSKDNFPASSPKDYPPGWEPLSSTTPVGQLPSAWWYANGKVNTPYTEKFIGPIANRQIGPSLQPKGTDSDPFWNTYAVAIRNDTGVVTKNTETGVMEGPYSWPMDDRFGGNLVYFDNPAGNSLKIEIGAPYTPAKPEVSISSTTSTVNDTGAASLVFEISRTEISSPLDVFYSIDTTEPSAAVLNKQYVIEGVTTPQMVKASFKSGEKAITINATPTPQTEKVLGTAFVKLKLDKDKSGNYSIDSSSSSATGSIISNAPGTSMVSVLIAGPSQIPDSANQQLIYNITRSGDLSDSLSISLNLAGTAVSGVNYNDGSKLTPGNNTAVFEKGQPALSYTITPIDTDQISPLTVILSIDPASGYTVVQGKASATGTILGTTVFEQVGFKQVSDKPGLWTSSVASSEKGNLGLTAFVSEAMDGTSIAGQQISLVDAVGNSIAGTQFSSSARQAGSLTQSFGQNLFNAKSLSEFQVLAASSEQRSIGGDNLKPITAPASDFAIKVASQDPTQATVGNSNGVYISSFENSTAVSFSSGIFDLFGQASPQNVQLQATSVGKNRNTLVAYRVDSITGAILQAGSWVKPGDAGYSQAALNNSLLKGDPLNLGFGESKVASFEEGTAKSADLFALALVTNGSISDYLASNPANQKGKGPNMFFSIGAANPDGAAHMVSLDSGVVGFEDLWGGGDFDFNDVVVAFKNVPIVPIP